MRRFSSTLLLIGWASAGTVLGISGMRAHWVPLPVPPAAAHNEQPLAQAGEWQALHVLLDGCGCSERVLAHLSQRLPVPDVRERILWVSATAAQTRATPGYAWESLNAEQLTARHGVEAAPVLIVLDPSGVPRYRGGYTARKQGFDIRDRTIIEQTLRGAAPPSLPTYGCPVSARLRSETSLLPP